MAQLRLVTGPQRPDRPALISLPHGTLMRIGRLHVAPPPPEPGVAFFGMNAKETSTNPGLLSRRHASIAWHDRDGALVLVLVDGHPATNTASSNGTGVDGQLVPLAGERELTIGSEVDFGVPHLIPQREAPAPREFVYQLELASLPAREQASEDEQERQQPARPTARPPSLPPRVRARVALPQLTTRSSAHGCARACSQDDPPCGACLAAGCTLCGLADAHEEEVQAHADGCSRLHYALYGTDDEESSDDEAVEELESTLEPPEGEAAAVEAILLEWSFLRLPFSIPGAQLS